MMNLCFKYCLLMAAAVLGCCSFFGQADAQTTHTVFYEGSDNELHVYRVYGAKPGKTLLLIGGIQGDEPGGFLAADLYADFSLETGNLIVVPRANFPSILQQKRKVNEDMNRKFADDHVPNYEAKVVKVLKQLIHESDCLLNLHEGSGVYSEKWEGPMRNPSRFGQSIIADARVLETSKTGEKIDLEAMAKAVVGKVNSHIGNPKHFFHFNNHMTQEKDTIHQEQRKSATYYALYKAKIPAFGVESAKALPLEQKVRQHIYAINGFMELLDIVPETPGVDLKKPELKYMIISVNDSVPVVVMKGQHLQVQPNDIVEVLDIEVNYERGLSVDIVGLGSRLNDMGRKVRIERETRIVGKKDFYPCGSVYLDFKPDTAVPGSRPIVSEPVEKDAPMIYRIRINNRRLEVGNNEHVELVVGDTFEIEDIVTPGEDPSDFTVNFKGFVGNPSVNTGEDRGYVVDTGKDVLMKRYSMHQKGRRYYVVTTRGDTEVGRLYIDLKPSTGREK
ncbi:MAG: hypothetical protein GY737_15750 [Desulfobacteraceae bacterium]|nr:hypothetical protein [Desulfobacteraceae bacterium]